MSFTNRLFISAQIGYLVIALCALILFPGADVIPTLISFVGVWLIVAMIYSATSHCNMAGWWTLLIATTILAVGIIANIHYFTELSGGTTSSPILQNPDAKGYYLYALYHHTGDEEKMLEYSGRKGYGLIISLIWKFTGVTIVPPIILNMLMMLLSIIISGVITSRLLGNSNATTAPRLSTLAMILTASVCYYLNSGTLLLKEAGIGLAISLIALGMTSIVSFSDNHATRIKLIVCFFVGLLLLCILRYTYIIITAIGILSLISWRNKDEIRNALPLLLLCIIAWGAMALIFNTNINNNAEAIADGSSIGGAYFFDHEQHRFYNNLIGNYLEYPLWKKILILPLSATTQFLVPFPWNFSRDMIFGYTLAFAHVTYPWYIIGGLILFFITIGWRKAPSNLCRFTFAGATMWLVPAYLFAGTVSRYALPMLPILIPAAVFVIMNCRQLKSFKIWSICYVALLAITLITCYHLQQSGINA